jgi:hypothetical protein
VIGLMYTSFMYTSFMYSVVKVDHVRGADREVMFTCDQKEGTKMTRYSILIEGTRQ